MPQAAGIRVFMVEDHEAVRQGLRLLLEQDGIQVSAEADTLAGARAALEADVPDLVLLDLSLGEENGLDLLRHLSRVLPALPVLVYSMFEDASHVEHCLQAGARGYLTKREASTVLTEAIRACTSGERFLSPRVKRIRLEDSAFREALSLQEQQVFTLLGQGLTMSAIAARMDLSPRTVESYCSRIQVKLGQGSMSELRQKAIQKRT